MAGLLYLQHAYRLSDETVVARWVENPYYQHLTGETFFQHRSPIDPSSLTRWRNRIGEEGVEWMLTQTIEAGRKSGAIDGASLKRVAVDTTVMEKAIAHPTDVRLFERARARGRPGARGRGGVAPVLRPSRPKAGDAGRPLCPCQAVPPHAQGIEETEGYTGRVMRDLRRHLDDIPTGPLRDQIIAKLALASQLLHQQPKGSNKIYALHEPEVDCISKGKARVRYEFGCKVSIATTLDEGFVTGMRSFPGNPYEGHTLAPALEQVEILTNHRPDLAVVHRGYPLADRAFVNAREAWPRRGQDPRADQRNQARTDTQACS